MGHGEGCRHGYRQRGCHHCIDTFDNIGIEGVGDVRLTGASDNTKAISHLSGKVFNDGRQVLLWYVSTGIRDLILGLSI
jgi:hypothetical protein